MISNHLFPANRESNRKYLLLLLFCLYAGMVTAQSDFWFQPAQSANRISEHASRDLIKDHYGFLWIATIDGLNRYDGYRFQTYRAALGDSLAISDNYVSDLYEDRNGTLWVATFDGLNRYNPYCDCFTNYLEEYKRNGAPGTIVTKILEDAKGNLWVASYNGLSYLPPGAEAFIPVPVTPEGLLGFEVTSLSLASGGGLWIGYKDLGFSLYKRGNWTHYKAGGIEEVKEILQLNASELLIAARNGIFLVNPISGESRLLRKGQFAGINQIGDRIIIRSYFFGTYEWLSDRKELKATTSYYQGKKIDGDMHVYLQDSGGTIWGMYQGLIKQDAYEQRFHHAVVEANTLGPALPSSVVTGIRGDSSGRLVITTQYGGILTSQEPFGPWTLNAPINPTFEDIVLQGFPFLDEDQAWVLDLYSLLHYDLSTGKLTKFPQGKGTRAIMKDSKGRRWIIHQDFGLGRFSPPTLAKRVYEDLGDRLPAAITEDHKGNIWLLADGDLYRYLEAEDRFEHVSTIISKNYRDRTHRSLLVDKRNNVWVSTIDGLFRYELKTGKSHSYARGSGLVNSKVSSILEDDHGVWVSTNLGLSYFDFATENFRNYDTGDGLINTIYLPGSAYKSPSGWMYFGGINGIDYFHPDSLPGQDPSPPQALLQKVTLLNAADGDPDKILFPETSSNKPLEISYRSLPLQFDMIGLGFTQADKNKYAFLMEGVDDRWNYSSTNRITIYSSLPRGTALTFRVKAASHDGVWSETKDYHIYIEPPFWQTVWFRMLIAGLFVVGMLMGYRYRVRQIRLQNQNLEREVKEKTKEIAQQAENLEEANTSLRQQAEEIREKAHQLNQLNVAQSGLFTNLSHEFRTLLTLMLGYLDELIVAEDPVPALPVVLKRMRMNAGEMLRLVDQLMDTARLESGRYSLVVSPGDLGEECRNVVSSFHILAKKQHIDLELEIRKDFPEMVWFDRDIFYKVLSNLLSNALKFTPSGGKVRVELSLPGDHVILQVKDTGIGIPENEISKIFERFHQVRQADGNFNGTGIGLALVAKLLERHRGQIKVESNYGVGTSFSVLLPARPDVYTADELQSAGGLSAGALSHGHSFPSQLELPVYKNDKSTPSPSEYQILLIEDNAEMRALIARQLSEEYQVLEAADGRIGLELAVENIPDLIISDRLMPNMNGLEFCQALRTDNRTSHIPVIMLTAMSTEIQKLEGLRSGADLYLPKPFSRQELGLIISNQLSSRDRMRKQFIQSISLDYIPDQLNPTDRSFLQKLNTYVGQRIDSDIDINELTKALGVSRTQLFRKMKSLLGMSITEFVRDYRLRRAFELVQESELRIGEIIQATGFNSRSYFYRSFREKFGCSPSEMKDTGQLED